MSKLSLFTFIVCIYHTYNEICIMHRKILCQLSYDTPDLISTIFFVCRRTQIGIFQSHKVQSGVIYQCMRRHSARTSSEHLEFYRSGEGFLYFHVNFGQRAQSTV